MCFQIILFHIYGYMLLRTYIPFSKQILFYKVCVRVSVYMNASVRASMHVCL